MRTVTKKEDINFINLRISEFKKDNNMLWIKLIHCVDIYLN